MKTAEDFKKAIGTPDAAFEDCVLHTLLSMESPKVRRAFSARTAWAIAAMLIVMTITAGAVVKKWDLQTFLRYYERNVRGNMTEPAITAEEWSNQWATIRVRELMHDGCMLYCVYEVVPKDKNMLLLSADADDPEMAKMYMERPWNTGEGEYSAETAAEYAQRTGAQVVFVEIEDYDGEGRYVCGEREAWRSEDGVLTIYNARLYEPAAEDIQLELLCEMQLWTERTVTKKTKTISVSLPAGNATAELKSTSSVYYDRYGVRLHEARIVCTELGTLLYTRCTVEEMEKCRNISPMFEFSKDTQISRKFAVHSYEEEDGSISQYSWWGIMDEIPASVTLELLRLDSHQIILEPAK
ncbi:MAG: hypothetical protein II343_00260 [Clostridia bacterium]|nr:hypothetical protein [Clostridia bacterium]